MADPRYAQRMYTLLSMDGSAMSLAEQTYDAHIASGGEPDPQFEALRAAAPGSATFVKLQRELMAKFRGGMR